MDELNRFVFYGEWLDNIKDLPLDIQDKIIAEIVRYGTNNCRQYEENMMVSMAVNFTKGAIDNAKLEYLKKVINHYYLYYFHILNLNIMM